MAYDTSDFRRNTESQSVRRSVTAEALWSYRSPKIGRTESWIFQKFSSIDCATDLWRLGRSDSKLLENDEIE